MRALRLWPLLVLGACGDRAPAPTPAADAASDRASLRATIEGTNARLVSWYAEGALDSVLTVYAPDAVLMGPNQPVAAGTAAIRTAWEGMLASGTPRFTLETVDVRAADSLAVEHGRYTLTLRAKPPADTTRVLHEDRGNYVVLWARRGDRWQIVYDIATSELPPARQD